MDVSTFQEYIEPGLLVLIPVLYLLGVWIRDTSWIDNKHIPLLLAVIGIALAVVYLVATAQYETARDIAQMLFTAIVQGILCAGCSVWVNQVVKQNSANG